MSFEVFRVSHVRENKTNKKECGGWEQRSCHSWKRDFVFWASVCPEEVIAFWHSLIFYHGHVEQRHGRIGPLGSIFQLFFKL